jgi:excisionase family DNA binding protein
MSDESMDEQNALMTVAETAKALGRSTEQVRRYLREGELPGRRLGGQWFIARRDVEQFCQDRMEPLAMTDASAGDPLASVIAIGGSGGADVATGRIPYLASLAEQD